MITGKQLYDNGDNSCVIMIMDNSCMIMGITVVMGIMITGITVV